ncbi:MAG: hypothetical protein ACREGE_02970 [Candidatus Microsaccharimonas sp.]
MKPRLIVEQKITAFVNRYEIYRAAEDGTKTDMIAFAEQKRMAFKEKVNFFTDASKNTLAFSFRAEKVMDIHGKFFVEDAENNKVGAFKKEFKKSLLNSTWNILGANDSVVLTVSESNQALAIIRRFIGWIPLVGELFETATNFIKYHFSFYDPSGAEVGAYRKMTLFRDHYTLSLDDVTYAAQDWRVLASMAVALDALQTR